MAWNSIPLTTATAHRRMYVDVGTEKYLLRGARKDARYCSEEYFGWKTDYFIYFVLAT
jgi:hypothetical protein